VNGPEHYAEAEKLIAEAERTPNYEGRVELIGAAQVHATLALVAATVVGQYGVAPMAIDNNSGAWGKVLRSAARERSTS